ncbi:MAG: steroid delta-isomerase, partial [Mycobacterium sp.]|nr:steroid delta-isomerase [Mycobacterium sp.]
MSFEPDALQSFVQRYLDTVAGGTADDVAAL